MRYSPSEKAEIIRLVEDSHLSAKKTLEKLGIPRSTFYRWLDQLHAGGPEALADRPSRPGRIWNRLPETIQRDIVVMALEAPDEFLLAATAQNLRRLAKLRPMGGQMQPITA
ncbi:transposase-like protein [Rhodoblastus acidophilus]|nr:transposase-like protein [Rhodoblastus acidophilus]MCW2335516.1 transposase-like protein [Rhodoblastus acidophilus]